MKCKYCDGTGEHINDANRMTTCEFCGGTGKIGVTKEEWFCQLPTAEKAKWLSQQVKFIYNCGEKGSIPKFMYEEDFVQWLKEKHI